MNISDIFQETYSALSSNKVRSGLTILGIVIGIASVIAMLSIGQGASNQIESSIEGLGSNLLTVSPGFMQQGRGFVSMGRGSAESLKNEDADALRGLAGVFAVSPERQERYQVVASTGNNTNLAVIGVFPDYMSVRNVSVANGSFITATNMRGTGRVAVLGPTAASDLFGEEDPIGKVIRLGRLQFKVIGVLQAKGGAGFFNPDETIFVPLSTVQKVLSGGDHLSSIAISVEKKERMPQVQAEAIFLLAERHRVSLENPDFSIVSQEDVLGTLTQVTDTFAMFLAAVAGISLLVGGIGIMNMMLTTVTERTREIGLRKAIGAKKKDVNAQFLVEAVCLTFLGGVLGVFFGWLIAASLSVFAGVATQVSLRAVFLAFGVCVVIGVVFGYYPARRAASLHPIDALRYE